MNYRPIAARLAGLLCRTCGLGALLLAVMMPFSGRAEAARDFSRETARVVPTWLRDGIIYEIFPRNFSATGDFGGITARLDELHDLGVTILWLMPIHPTGKEKSKGALGSPYAVKDYYGINPDYGTAEDLKKLVKEAHQRGMKVIIDIVANHTAWDSVLMKHPEFYKQDGKGKIIPPVAGWSDVAGLNYGNPQLREYMTEMLKHWVDPKGFDLDGFRCDVAYMVPTSFWEEARGELMKVKPDIMMLAEASAPDLMVKAFDADYSWPLLGTLNDVLLNGAPATELKKTWEEGLRKFPQGTLHMRITDDHDEARAVTRFGIEGALAASVLMLSLDGVPLLYNGMEVGDATESGDPALFERMPVFWQPRGRPSLRDIYRNLIKLRNQHPAFRNGKVTWLKSSNEADLVALSRSDEHDEFVVVVNLSNRPVRGQVEVPNSQEFKLIVGGVKVISNGFPALALKGFEYRIYQRSLTAAIANH
ncbi:MAG: alpha amylase catalytic region [Pedosphaera sp.]|nr:alpha amylase catalytic region [Pedosphaera sp.]